MVCRLSTFNSGKMVCKRDWSVDRGGGSPMTTTGPADIVMAACSRAVAGPLVPALPGLPANWSPSSRRLRRSRTVVRAVFPRVGLPQTCRRPHDGPVSARAVAHPLPRLRRRHRLSTPSARPGTRSSVCARLVPHSRNPLYLYLLEWPARSTTGWSIDPGRDMLCIPHLTAAMAPVALSTQGLVTYLQGLFGPIVRLVSSGS